MSANFENKKLVVEEIKNNAKDSKSIVLVDYKGLTVAQVTELGKLLETPGQLSRFIKTDL